MVLKLNISENGKAWRKEIETEILAGKSIGDKIEGKEISSDFVGYEFILNGGTDSSGFPLMKSVEGLGLKRVLLTKGWGMHDKRKGVRLRKTVRGKVISDKTIQINMIVEKEGTKKLSEIFPEQNKGKEVNKEKIESSIQEENN